MKNFAFHFENNDCVQKLWTKNWIYHCHDHCHDWEKCGENDLINIISSHDHCHDHGQCDKNEKNTEALFLNFFSQILSTSD